MFGDDCDHCEPSMDVYIDGRLTSRVIDRYENVLVNSYITANLPVPRLLHDEKYFRMMNGNVWIVKKDEYPNY
jgi:hypothetical protein